MKCSQCGFENPDDFKFCNHCGQKLTTLCPSCNTPNPQGSTFCGNCGQLLSVPAAPLHRESSFDEMLSKIQRYLPQGLTDKILAQRDRIEGERKQVTVLFTDMAGYTSLAEKLDPEEAYALIDQVYEILIHKVTDYGGTVNELMGDGIVALFGAPIALEDAPQRAIRASLAIHREMVQFSDKMRYIKPGLPHLRMRAGIHTGPVVVGTVGNDLRIDFKAVGDTVNLASRLQGLAEPGTTYVTADTFKLTEGLFRFEALGEKIIKGKENPIKIYQVIAHSTRRTRFDVSAERGLTPFIGRERERELLLEGLERVREGRGQAFTIVAEAGVGKSRLLYEFRKAIANEDVTFLEGKCLSYGRTQPYCPIIDILKGNFGIQEDDDDERIREKVTFGLKTLEVDTVSNLPYILELLSVKDSGLDEIPLSTEGKRDKTIETLKQIILHGAAIRPLIIAIEDLHWADMSTENALKYFLEIVPGTRVLLIFTYRPEFVHTWGSRSYLSQVMLNRLSNRECLIMAAYLLGATEIDRDIEELILRETEGVPFFIEEFIESLKDLNIIERTGDRYRLTKDLHAVTIPSTIQDVILARVDSLPQGAKEVLQTGSVIEREFSHKLIEKITDLSEQQLLSHLSALKDSELLYERGIYPHSTYIFKHALTREVVYDSILTRKRKSLHEEIGKAIEEICKDNLDDYYEILVEHFIASENYEKGATYSRHAARKSAKTASLNDAISNTQRRVFCLEKAPQSADIQKELIDARTILGLYFLQITSFTEAKKAITPITDMAIHNDYKNRLGHIYTILASYYSFVEEDLPGAFRAFGQALQISEEANNIISSLFASFYFGIALSHNCNFEKARFHFQRSIDFNVTAIKPMIAAIKSSLATFCYFSQGNIDLSFQTTSEALRMAEESGDIWSKGMAYTSHGLSCFGKGMLEETEKNLLKGLELCERISFHSWQATARCGLAEMYNEMGEISRAKEQYEKYIHGLERSLQLPSWVGWAKVGTVRSKVMDGEKDVDFSSLYTQSRNNKFKTYEGWISRYIGEIFLHIDDHHMSEAEDWISKSIEADKKNSMRFHLGKDYALYAEFFKRKGDRMQARENLGRAIEILKECGADGWVKKYTEELARL